MCRIKQDEAKMFKYFLVAFLLTGLVACAPAETSNSETVTLEDKVLVIGDISREPTETMAYWEPFVKHLEANLADGRR